METLDLRNTAIILILLTAVGRGRFETVRCPRYCTCYLNTTDNMRSVACVARRLDNIDVSVPKRVQTLDLSNNTISILEDRGFQSLGLVEVVNLFLKHNSIRAISLHSFTGLIYLKKVDLTGNYLYQILPWTFHDNSNLKFLSLSSNPLGHITPSGPILDIPSLEVLELSHCNFGYFSEDAFTGLPNLKRLDISHNQLISLDISMVFLLHYLTELDVSKNPWPCNANMKNLQDFLESKSSKLTGSSCDLLKGKENINTKPVMFEKMISLKKDYSEYEDFGVSDEDEKDSANVGSSEEISKERDNCVCKDSVEIPASLEGKTIVIPPTWLMLVSFQLGVCTTLFSGYCCIYCCTKRKKYEPLERTSVPSVMENTNLQPNIEDCSHSEGQSTHSSLDTIAFPDTPPPSYRELFYTSNLQRPL